MEKIMRRLNKSWHFQFKRKIHHCFFHSASQHHNTYTHNTAIKKIPPKQPQKKNKSEHKILPREINNKKMLCGK